jgi:Tol biopolymer transport system component
MTRKLAVMKGRRFLGAQAWRFGWRSIGLSLVLLVGAAGLFTTTVFAHSSASSVITLVSIASDGTKGDRASDGPSISSEGHFIAFESAARNLVPGDTNGAFDVFVHDRVAGATSRVSVGADGAEGNDDSRQPAISADGRYVAFSSAASNLVPDDGNDAVDVFLHDRRSGETRRVSVASDGAEGNSGSYAPAVSADGRFVVFHSAARNLVQHARKRSASPSWDVYVHDTSTGETTQVSVASDGSPGNDDSEEPTISADGRYVAFSSAASNLVPDDGNDAVDVFLHDRRSGETRRVSVASDGAEGDAGSEHAAISADGRYVAFRSGASNLVTNDTNGRDDVFVHDHRSGETVLVSLDSSATWGNDNCGFPSLSGDGRFVAFWAAELLPVATGWEDGTVLVHDRLSGETTRVSIASDGAPAPASLPPVISADGGHIAFSSRAENLTPDSGDRRSDVFVFHNEAARDQLTPAPTAAAEPTASAQGLSATLFIVLLAVTACIAAVVLLTLHRHSRGRRARTGD